MTSSCRKVNLNGLYFRMVSHVRLIADFEGSILVG